MQASAALNVCDAWRFGGDESIPEADFLAEGDRFGLLNEQRVRARVDGEAVDLLAQDDASRARRRFEDDEGPPAPRQLIGRRQPRDPAADYGYVNHIPILFVVSRVRVFVPSCLRAFVSSCFRAFVVSCLRGFVPSWFRA